MTQFKVTFNRNVKFGKNPYRKGDTVIIHEEQLNVLKDSKVITSNIEELLETPTEQKEIEEMTVPELKEYAAEHNVDLTGITKKEDMQEAIQSYLEEINDENH